MLHQYPISFETERQPPTTQAMHTSSVPDRVMLATAVVYVNCCSGSYVSARALLDSGSQFNFMTEELAQKLRIRREKSTLNVIGIGNSNKKVQGKLNAFVKSRVNDFEFSTDFWVMGSISANHPDHTVNTNGWKIPQNLELADPNFFKCQKIDILLGAETFFDLLSVGQIKTSPRQPTLQKTFLGWIISGKYASSQSSSGQVSSTLCKAEENMENIDATVQKFWALEELPSEANVKRLTPEQAECEQ
ncbi:uncharacterized protein LOC118732417, partial [Rhagoletis pomonella]|uniref:uncharacterized protein LOC118732417 n=1 Tax=Rhagoletis pomonella TaxID=28610 RepID=UPI001784D178